MFTNRFVFRDTWGNLVSRKISGGYIFSPEMAFVKVIFVVIDETFFRIFMTSSQKSSIIFFQTRTTLGIDFLLIQYR